jgi:UDP-N-acetylmuramate dehydrogenase
MIEQGVSLRTYNSFGVAAEATLFAVAKTIEDLQSILKDQRFASAWILGGGSNTLFCDTPKPPIIHLAISGVEITEEQGDDVVIKAGAGVNWHELVLWSLEKGFGGLENLALIPGNVGAAPIQNIGAYGVELQDVFESCTLVNRNDQSVETYDKVACQFGYRDSIFKQELKNKAVITDVSFRLKKENYRLNTSYGAIAQLLASKEISTPSPKEIADVVIDIRTTKLPDPKQLGNAGSFFKNPIVDHVKFEQLKSSFPDIPHYVQPNQNYKIPAAWLIEHVGLKGTRKGDVGTHKHHALVLVNFGNASGYDIKAFSQMVQQVVEERFGVCLQPEVNFCC